jgi:hypothetical protein
VSLGPPKPSPIVRDKAKMDELYGIGDDERQELIDWIATLEVPAALQKTLAKGTDLELVADAWCPACNGRVKVRHPDYKGCAAFIKLLFEYKLQKPSEKRELHVTGRVLHSLDELTDAELDEVAEGKWVPKLLPPAA